MTAISNQINVEDKVRIVVEVLNDKMYNWNKNKADYVTIHEWKEVNGLLSDEDIIDYSESSHNSLNLILKANSLEQGITYSFQLTIYQNNEQDQLIAYGESSITSVYVLIPPQIVHNSFTIVPECGTYASINDYLSVRYSLFVSAYGDYSPLLYQFLYKTNANDFKIYYLHPSLLSTSYINDIILPIGNNILMVNIYDTHSSMVTDSIQCNIIVNSNIECADNFVVGEYSTEYDKYYDLLQRAIVYLQYISNSDNSNDCVQKHLLSILNALNLEINDLCENNFVILLAQVMELWIDIINLHEDLMDTFYTEANMELVSNLIFKSIDPCLYITNDLQNDVESLKVSQESVITNVVKIYDTDDNDITSRLSIIITQNNYKNILYSFAETLIKLINKLWLSDHRLNTIGLNIYNLLSSALHLASLSTISTSIPGELVFIESEEFSVYLTRSSNTEINITLQNISVTIPNDILRLNESDPLDSFDILIFGVNTSEQIVNVTKGVSVCNEQEEGVLSQESISITILGNTTGINNNNLAANITFTFNCDTNDCDDFQCVFYDESLNIWSNDGCVTHHDKVNDKVICLCHHLTTFATIHSLKSNSECDFYNNCLNELFNSVSWDYINWTFGVSFLLISIYIFLQILPFFLDEYLQWKQPSIIVMLLLCVVSLIYFIICVEFHLLKHECKALGIYTNTTFNILIFFLLSDRVIFFIIYTIIFYTWFVLAHSTHNTSQTLKIKARKFLYTLNFVIILLFLIFYVFTIMQVIKYSNEELFIVSIIWSVIIAVVCILFVIYAIFVFKVLQHAAQLSSGQDFQKENEDLLKRLSLINICIITFFITQLLLYIYFTLNINQFNSVFRSIDLSLSLSFIILLCWMYRNAMYRLVKYEANKNYNYYFCGCNKLCCLSPLRYMNKYKHAQHVHSNTKTKTKSTKSKTKSKITASIDVNAPLTPPFRSRPQKIIAINDTNQIELASTRTSDAPTELTLTQTDTTLTTLATTGSTMGKLTEIDSVAEMPTDHTQNKVFV